MKETYSGRKQTLQSLRNIGPKIEEKLHLIGIRSVEEFMAADPEHMYSRLEAALGQHIDPCVLYCFKGAQLDLPWWECKRFFSQGTV